MPVIRALAESHTTARSPAVGPGGSARPSESKLCSLRCQICEEWITVSHANNSWAVSERCVILGKPAKWVCRTCRSGCPAVLWISVGAGGGHREHGTAGWPLSWTQAVGGSLPPPLSLECILCSPFPKWGPFSRMQAWESKVLLRPSGVVVIFSHTYICDWTQLRLLYKLLIFGGWVQRPTGLVVAQ